MMRLRPLDKTERSFAAKNHELVYSFLQRNGLSEDVFYDVAVLGYIKAVKEYLTNPKLCVYAFSTIAWKSMQCAVNDHMRYLTAMSRTADVVSLYSPIGDDSDLCYEDILGHADDTSSRIEAMELLTELARRLSPLDMRLVRMKLAGCKMNEIASCGHMTYSEINRRLSNVQKDIDAQRSDYAV